MLLGKALGISGAGAVASYQRDRARHQPKHGVQAEKARHCDSERVLSQQEWKQSDQKTDKACSTSPKDREVGGQADRRKKQQ